MRYETVEMDFVRRTLALLEQYDAHIFPRLPHQEVFEVTLLLNCLLGLIVLPYEHLKRKQGSSHFPRISLDDERPFGEYGPEWGLASLRIAQFSLSGQAVPPASASLRQVVAMLRHAMAHSQFGDGGHPNRQAGVSVGYQPLVDAPIESVIIQVHIVNHYRNQVDFEGSISPSDLRRLATTFARTFLEHSQAIIDAAQHL